MEPTQGCTRRLMTTSRETSVCIEATPPPAEALPLQSLWNGAIQHRRAKASSLNSDHPDSRSYPSWSWHHLKVIPVYFSHLSILSIGEVNNTPQRVCYVRPVGFEPTRPQGTTELKSVACYQFRHKRAKYASRASIVWFTPRRNGVRI